MLDFSFRSEAPARAVRANPPNAPMLTNLDLELDLAFGRIDSRSMERLLAEYERLGSSSESEEQLAT